MILLIYMGDGETKEVVIDTSKNALDAFEEDLISPEPNSARTVDPQDFAIAQNENHRTDEDTKRAALVKQFSALMPEPPTDTRTDDDRRRAQE